nr:uncharacterized protein CFP56_45193 [Quercus suber]
MWVQVWGLPFDLLLEEVGRDIGSGLGEVLEIDLKAFSSDQARFIRVRVELPLYKPLRLGGVVASLEGDKVCIGFKYERLVGLCYQCGRIGYEDKDCSVQRDRKHGGLPYREWLKNLPRFTMNIIFERDFPQDDHYDDFDDTPEENTEETCAHLCVIRGKCVSYKRVALKYVHQGEERMVLILDDTKSVWSKHPFNLIHIKRYRYFDSDPDSWNADEVESTGPLIAILQRLNVTPCLAPADIAIVDILHNGITGCELESSIVCPNGPRIVSYS